MPYAPQGTLIKADLDTHEAAVTGIHGVGSLNIAGFHSTGEEVSKVIWKDASSTALTDFNRTEVLDWTDLDLTEYVSPNAKFAILGLRMRADTVGTDDSDLKIRKNGTTPGISPILTLDAQGTTPGVYKRLVTIIGLDSGQVIEYCVAVGPGGWQLDSIIDVLGYIE